MKRTLKILGIVFGSLAVFAIILIGLYFLTFNTNFWLKYPNPLKTQVAFARLEFSSYNRFCREDCMFEREALRKMIAAYLVDEPIAMSGQIDDYLMDKDVASNFKKELVLVLKRAEAIKKEKDEKYKIKTPEILTEFLNRPGMDMDVKKSIMNEFGAEIGLNAGFLDGLINIIKDTKKNNEERISAMHSLYGIIDEDEEGSFKKEGGPFPKHENIKYENICDLLLSIAENEDDQEIKYEAISYFSPCTKFKENYTEDLFDRLEKLFYQPGLHKSVQDLILADLSSYSDINKEKSVEALKKVYNDQNINKFFRSLVARRLKEKGISGYQEVEISEEEWNDFFVNLRVLNSN